MKMQRTVGALEKNLVRASAHSTARLVERFGVHPDRAPIIYHRDTVRLRRTNAKPLTQGRIGGQVWWAEDMDGIRFPVTRAKHNRLIIVTYLTADMVYDTMMGE